MLLNQLGSSVVSILTSAGTGAVSFRIHVHKLNSKLLESNRESSVSREFCSARPTWVLLLLFVWLNTANCFAAVTIGDVNVGNGSLFRVGHFTQIRIVAESDQSLSDVRLELATPDGEGVRSVTVKSVSISAGENDIEALAKFGRVRSELTVRFLNGDELLAEKTIRTSALLATQSLALTLGPDVAVADAISLRQEKNEQETIHGIVTDPHTLPSNWMGYQGVHLVVLPSGAKGLASQMSDQQLEALDQWTRMGGRLILSCGSRAESMLGEGGPLARFLPGEFDRLTKQRQTGGIENFVGRTEQSLSSFVADNEVTFTMPMAILREPRGKAMVAEGIGRERTPLVLRASHGFGHVIFVATDLDQGPISQWQDGRRRLVGKLLDVALGSTERDDGEQKFSQLTQIGFDDLTGQLRAGLDQFAQVKLVPFSWIAVLTGLYILLIGPVDYFLLRRLKERFGWTWVTFPLVVLGASILAYVLTQHWKGRSLHVNQVDVVDFDSTTGMTRGLTWAHIFSPVSRKYDVQAKPTETLFPIQKPRGEVATWQGLPGDSFGGMNTTRVSPATVSYEISLDVSDSTQQSVSVSQLPVDVYASRSVHGLHWGQVALPEMPKLVADIEDQIQGEVRNPLPVDLKECVLCYGRLAYPVGTLPAGGGTIINRFGAKKISSRLTRWKVDMDHKGQSTAWNRRGLDVERILEIMMFHDAAGGSKYTSLLNRFQGEVDFSDHLEQGTAMLVGKVKLSPTQMLGTTDNASDVSQEDDAGTQVTFVRILMPVKPRSSSRSGT